MEASGEETAKPSKIEKLLFFGGLALVIAGGPGLAIGSWLHDVLRIPIGGSAFAVFGWLNRLVAALGLLVLLVGIVMLILSIRLVRPTFEYDVGSVRES